ncbi:PAAR domain-containing protein [Burkholderia pseudomallei]|uniref:PAAR domain-containing protein n=1 Tax=Burkholderia pseudomallei TaxID=28450 RepID=UPI001592BC0C|nr:PAAR domain-containing protein [Burkholderia pseudomallei]MBF3497980.1 PAAR domain-containing protein [Burkholderia pseudomallei]NVH67159.1 PAAR domain-containing protein [Burkholderia pseudomallei]
MGFAFIREGDATTHGGRVLACTSTFIAHGKAIALLGDMVSCPRCGGIFPIVRVKQRNMALGERPVATDGDKTACGATLIASQGTATVMPTAGASAGASTPVGGGRGVVPSPVGSMRGGLQRGRFQTVDDDTGQPIPNHPYTVTGSGGQIVSGRTDESGYTDWVESNGSASLTFDYSGSKPA